MSRKKLERSRSRSDSMIYETDGVRLAVNPGFTEPEVEITAVQPGLESRHTNHKHGTNLIQCQLCKSRFRRQDHLRRHVETVHATEKSTACPLCGVDCKEDLTFISHMKTSHPMNDKLFCTSCRFIAETPQQLEYHNSCHVVTKTHRCGTCSALFKRRDHLARHVRSVHSSECVSCGICDKIFKRRDHMLRHIREKHPVRMEDVMREKDTH